MRKKTFLLLLLVPILYLAGCVPAQIKVNRFEPIPEPPYTSNFLKANETYVSYESADFKIATALFEYSSIMVLPLEILNKTNADLESDEYSISLHDGRDFKPIQMLTRENLISAKSKMEGGAAVGGGIEQQLIQSTLNSIMDATRLSSKKVMLKGLDDAIDNYFSFRAIYAREKREGILCFMVDFKLEYPITLMVKIKDKVAWIRFQPQNMGKGGEKS